MTGFVVFLKEFIALYYWYIELFTRKILNIHAWIPSCPDGITPNSGLTGPKKKIYIYIYIYMLYIYIISYFDLSLIPLRKASINFIIKFIKCFNKMSCWWSASIVVKEKSVRFNTLIKKNTFMYLPGQLEKHKVSYRIQLRVFEKVLRQTTL